MSRLIDAILSEGNWIIGNEQQSVWHFQDAVYKLFCDEEGFLQLEKLNF